MIFHELSRIVFFAGLFLLPLLFVPTIINGFEGPKIWFFQRWVLVLAIVVSFWILHSINRQTNKLLLISVFLYFFWNLLTSLMGVDPVNSFYGLFWREQGLITLAGYVALVWITMSLFQRRDLRVLRKILIASGFSVCCFVLFSIAANYFWDFPIYKYLNRHVGTMGNPNFLAGFISIVFPCIFIIRNFRIKLLLVSVYLLTIYLTGSRGAILALGVVGVFFGWLYIVRKFKSIGYTIAIFLVGGFVCWFVPWVNQIPWTDPNFAASRQRMWVRGYRAVVKKPILGYGLENYSIAVSKIVYPGGLRPEGEVYADKAHNEILEILVASGVPGLILWFLIFGLAARNYYQNKNYLFLAALLIFFVKAQTNVVSVSEYVLFWTLVGFSGIEV